MSTSLLLEHQILEDERVAFERLTEYIINNEVDCDFWSGQAVSVVDLACDSIAAEPGFSV